MFVPATMSEETADDDGPGNSEGVGHGGDDGRGDYDGDVGAQVASIAQAVDHLAGWFDPRLVTASQAMVLVTQLERVERQICGMKLRLAGRVADSQTWRHGGDRSAAHWLARQAGTSICDARAMLETADKLDELPATADALRDGKLSKAQASAVTDAAAVAPESEDELLRAVPRESLTGLRARAAKAKQAHQDEAEREAAIHASRRVRFGTDPDGAATMGVRTTASAMAEIKAALAQHQNAIFDQARRDGLREPFEAYAADALLAMARASLGVAGPTDDPTTRQASRISRVGTKVIVRIDHTALVRGHAAPGETCEVPGVGPIPVSHVRDLLADGDAFAAAVATEATDTGERVTTVAHLGHRPVPAPDLFPAALLDDGHEVTSARASRRPDAYQTTALDWTTPICTVEGCDLPRQQVDHRHDWADCHQTRLDDLDGYCAHHHALKTRNNYGVAPGTGKRPMHPPGHRDNHGDQQDPGPGDDDTDPPEA